MLKIPAPVLRAYLQRHPDDPAVVEIFAKQRRALEQQRLLAANTLGQVEPSLQRQLLQGLQSRLLHSSDPHRRARPAADAHA